MFVLDAEMSQINSAEVASREKCLEELEDFIMTCQQNITDMLDTLNWTPEHFMQVNLIIKLLFEESWGILITNGSPVVVDCGTDLQKIKVDSNRSPQPPT